MSSNPTPWVFPVLKVGYVHDGDTAMGVELDLGYHQTITRTCRLLGIDAPEIGQDGAGEAKAALQEYLDLSKHQVMAQTHEMGDFGRDLVVFWSDGVNVNQALLDAGLVKEYKR